MEWGIQIPCDIIPKYTLLQGYEDIDESEEIGLASCHNAGGCTKLTINAMEPPPLPQRNKRQAASLRRARGPQIRKGAISLKTKPPGKCLGF